eukprot:jgi/Ulvmu1/2481/UM137_0007.1
MEGHGGDRTWEPPSSDPPSWSTACAGRSRNKKRGGKMNMADVDDHSGKPVPHAKRQQLSVSASKAAAGRASIMEDLMQFHEIRDGRRRQAQASGQAFGQVCDSGRHRPEIGPI